MINKVHPNFDNGIEYVRLCELPFTQSVKFKNWLSPNSIFSMEVEEKIFYDCISYAVYEFWFENQTPNPIFQERSHF